VTNPKRARPPATHTTPDTIAIAPASATACCASPPDCARITARIMAASEESGPITNARFGPNNAYTSSGTIDA
jgi:hypothetical protein